MGTLTVVSCGIALLQDEGRHGWEHLGVSPSGAFDRERHRQACALMGDMAMPTIEAHGPIALRADVDAAMAVAGEVTVRIEGVDAGAHHVLAVRAGDIIEVDPLPQGRGPASIAVAGLLVDPVLGSRSTDTMSGLGPAPLRPGTTLALEAVDRRERIGSFLLKPTVRQGASLRVVAGPHLPLATGSFIVRGVSRSGIRLDAATPLTASGDLPSLPVRPGAIQVPPDGHPIVLGPDSGVTGGYPVMGVVIEADLPLLARLRAGDAIRFAPVSPQQAREEDLPVHRAIPAVMRPHHQG